VGCDDGNLLYEGNDVGNTDGLSVAIADGKEDGRSLGLCDGWNDGAWLGSDVGVNVGRADGALL